MERNRRVAGDSDQINAQRPWELLGPTVCSRRALSAG